ncbi:MAG: hypothetical protein ABIR94_07495 [Rubrivivax sp.]
MKTLLLVSSLLIPAAASAHGSLATHLHGGDLLGLALVALIAAGLWWERSRQ